MRYLLNHVKVFKNVNKCNSHFKIMFINSSLKLHKETKNFIIFYKMDNQKLILSIKINMNYTLKTE